MQDQQLSAHFRLSEFTASQTATRFRIPNEPNADQVANLRRVAELLELVREAMQDRPVVISSGYRCPELNRRVGGATRPPSAHIDGRAADFTVPAFGDPRSVGVRLLCDRPVLAFDQLILEGTWLHIAVAPLGAVPRREVLTAIFRADEPTTYARGLLPR